MITENQAPEGAPAAIWHNAALGDFSTRDPGDEPGWVRYVAAQEPAPAEGDSLPAGSVQEFAASDNPRCRDGYAACIDCLMRGECASKPQPKGTVDAAEPESGDWLSRAVGRLADAVSNAVTYTVKAHGHDGRVHMDEVAAHGALSEALGTFERTVRDALAAQAPAVVDEKPAAWIRWEWNRSGGKSLEFFKPDALSLADEARGVVYDPLYSRPLAPLPKGWTFNHAQQQKDEDGPVDGVWEIGFLDPEDDRFSPIVTVDTGLYYQDKQAEPLARAILARLTTSDVPVQHREPQP